MKTLHKAPWVISVGCLGICVGAIVVESVGAAGATPMPPVVTVTANQGAPGTHAWLISGEVSVDNLPSTQPVSGNVGITGSLPTSANKIGSVTVSNLPNAATPFAYENYQTCFSSADGSHGGTDCERPGTIPSGSAFVAEQVEVDVEGANSPTSYSSPSGTATNGYWDLYADGTSVVCGEGNLITSEQAPGAESAACPFP